jgi:hypothetical protein
VNNAMLGRTPSYADTASPVMSPAAAEDCLRGMLQPRIGALPRGSSHPVKTCRQIADAFGDCQCDKSGNTPYPPC